MINVLFNKCQSLGFQNAHPLRTNTGISYMPKPLSAIQDTVHFGESSKSSIRQATVGDIPAIQKIAYEAWPIAYKDILSPTQIAYDLERSYSDQTLHKQMAEERQVFFLIEKGGDPIGFAAVSPWDENSDHLFLHKLYLMPGLKGQGHGTKLMDAVYEYAKEQGLKTVSLLVNRYNDAQVFYEKQGFSIKETRDEEIGGVDGGTFWRNDYLMSKELS